MMSIDKALESFAGALDAQGRARDTREKTLRTLRSSLRRLGVDTLGALTAEAILAMVSEMRRRVPAMAKRELGALRQFCTHLADLGEVSPALAAALMNRRSRVDKTEIARAMRAEVIDGDRASLDVVLAVMLFRDMHQRAGTHGTHVARLCEALTQALRAFGVLEVQAITPRAVASHLAAVEAVNPKADTRRALDEFLAMLVAMEIPGVFALDDLLAPQDVAAPALEGDRPAPASDDREWVGLS